MKFNRIMTVSAVTQLRKTFSTKSSPLINGKYFQKISPKPSHTIHKFASKNEYSNEDDVSFCYRYLEKHVNRLSLTRGDPLLEKKLKMILLEIYDHRCRKEFLIPNRLEEKHYRILLNLPAESLRTMFLIELYKYNDRQKLHVPKESERKNYVNIPNHIWYACDHNTMVIKISPEVNMPLDAISCASMLYGNDIVIDLSFEDTMELNELSQCVGQLHKILNINLLAPSSFNIHLCNLKKKGKIFKLYKSMYGYRLDDLIINVHEESYLDVFSRERLIYLSPHAQDELINYNSDHVYIIGGVLDKFPYNHPYSYNKASSENVTVRRFPLDEVLNWKRGSKTLGVSMSFKILADFNYYRSWDKAFENLNVKYVENHQYQSQVKQYRNLLTALKNVD